MVFIIFILNTAGSFFGWYSLLPWYDNMMHFLGGGWLSLVAAFLLFNSIKKHNNGTLFSIIFFVLIGAVLWEFLEYFVQYITKAPGALANIPDSISDVVFGVLGGFVFGYNIIKGIKKHD